MDENSAAPHAEFSRPVALARLGEREARYEIAATAGEREALARRFGLVALDRLEADIRLRREPGGVRLAASFAADIVQECVVTLEPFASHVGESFAIVYRRQAAHADEMVDPGEDDVEPLVGDEIDIGEAVAQQLSLSLDPYPHAPGAVLPDVAAEAGDEAAAPRPFAALEELMKRQRGS